MSIDLAGFKDGHSYHEQVVYASGTAATSTQFAHISTCRKIPSPKPRNEQDDDYRYQG